MASESIMEETFEKACADRVIPGAILHATSRRGNHREGVLKRTTATDNFRGLQI